MQIKLEVDRPSSHAQCIIWTQNTADSWK